MGWTLDKQAFRTAARQIGCVTGMSDDRKWKLFVKWRGMSNAVIKEVEMLWFSHQSVERAIEDACYLPRHLTAIRLEGPNDECFDEKEILKLATEHRAQKFATGTERNLKKKQATRVQYGALPYRLKDDASVEVLLVTSRQTKRWIIPKGWPIKGLTPAEAAAREAYEEAGIQGFVTKRPIGSYRYEKRLDNLDAYVPCKVKVFPMVVNRQSEEWLESKERMTCWFPAAQAAQLVGDKDLSGLILQLEEDLGSRRQSRPR